MIHARRLLLSAMLVAVACKGGQPAQDTSIVLPPQITQAPPAPVFTPPRVVEIGRELLLNGDAEADNGGGMCSPGPHGRITAWAPDAVVGVASYTGADAPTDTALAPPDRGKCYFRATLGAADSGRQLHQVIPVVVLADSIDGDHVGFALGGYVSSRADGGTAHLTVEFMDGDGHVVGAETTSADPVPTPTDKGLYLREVRGAVPVHTRSARVTLTLMRNARACAGCAVTAFADQLSFVLTHR